MLEEELKIRVAERYFRAFDTKHILGKIDFCVAQRMPPEAALFGLEVRPLLWAEAKKGAKADPADSLAQLILTIGRARAHCAYIPPKWLAAFDEEKIAFLPFTAVATLLDQNDFNWNVTPSDHSTKEFAQLRAALGGQTQPTSGNPETATALRLFRYAEDDAILREFIKTNIGAGAMAQIEVDRNNFTSVYHKWCEAVKPTINIPDWAAFNRELIMSADFFLADLMSLGNKTMTEKLRVLLDNDRYKLKFKHTQGQLTIDATSEITFTDGQRAHTAFWTVFHRPPRAEYIGHIIERRDLLVPQDVRERKGAFFTPQKWVRLSQQYIARALGENWQEEYYVWDCCAGTGNLLAGLTNTYNIWASTLDQADVDVMLERIANGANLAKGNVFQFDFLNDDFSKLPAPLRAIVNDPEERKKLVIYINPPYAEVSSKIVSGDGTKGKRGVNDTFIHAKYADELGTAGRELYAQFLLRVYKEIPGCVIANFSTLKILQGSAFVKFRHYFTPNLLRLFIVPSNTFDNVKGAFGIGFYIWDCGKAEPFKSVVADVYDADTNLIGNKKLFHLEKRQFINAWIGQFKCACEADAIGFMDGIQGNDVQHNSIVYILNSKKGIPNPRGLWINRDNLVACCVYLAVRRSLPSVWLNKIDQYLFPEKSWEADMPFQTDCIVYTLFDNSITSAHGTNHWIPFTEKEVGAHTRFQSHFMSDYLRGKTKPEIGATLFGVGANNHSPQDSGGNDVGRANNYSPLQRDATPTDHLSPEACAVISAGRELWCYYHKQPIAAQNPDASLYDIRKYFQGVNARGQMNPTSEDAHYMELLGALKVAMKALAARIEEGVYRHGFLR